MMNGLKINLNHFPFLSYSGDNHGTWQLFRHVHSNLHNFNIIDEHLLAMLQPGQHDVGVGNNFTPMSYRQVEEIKKKRPMGQNGCFSR